MGRVHVPVAGHLRCRHAASLSAKVSTNELCDGCLSRVGQMSDLLIRVAEARTPAEAERAAAAVKKWVDKVLPGEDDDART